jgi:UDP-N-acetylmuramoyl-tripeptide--D-alanyl-D-alanine ligase
MIKPYLHAYQMQGYSFKWILSYKAVGRFYILDCALSAFFGAVWAAVYFFKTREIWISVLCALFLVILFGAHFITESQAKKPLVFTKRAVRFCALLCVVVAAYALLIPLILRSFGVNPYFCYLAYFSFPILYIAFFYLCAALITPFEKLNNRRYEQRAKKILGARPDLIKIAVTGSFGKTSVKEYLTQMLKDDFCVLATPESYNTPMGIAKTAGELSSRHQVFIAEMGARHMGDIKRLMEIMRPNCGVLTGISNQHLETFKSLENIIAEKRLVIDMLKDGGAAVANGECEHISIERENLFYCGFSEHCPYYADDIYCSADGSSFTLHLENDSVFCACKLLGKHNILNIVIAAAMAHKLGVAPEKIARAISALKPAPHRLQLLSGNGVTIIDDSFNASVASSRAALDALSMFSGRKIVMTPGLVELGENEREENFELGRAIAAVADVVILIGKTRSQPLAEGLEKEGFPSDSVFVFNSLADAKENFRRLLHIGDTLLILNDLPYES